MPGGRTGILSGARPLTPAYAWDAGQAITLRQADGGPVDLDGSVSTWQPTIGADGVNARWTSCGTNAFLQQVGGVDGGNRLAVRSSTTNLLTIPGIQPVFNRTWFVAYRWMGNPTGPYAYLLGKGANNIFGSWVALRKQSGNDAIYCIDRSYGLSLNGQSDPLATFDPVRDTNSLRVAVLALKTDNNYTYIKARLSNPTACFTFISGMIVPDSTALPWTLGGWMDSTVTQTAWGPAGADVAIHEVQVHDSILSDGQISTITNTLNRKWA